MTDDAPDHHQIVASRKYDPDSKKYVDESPRWRFCLAYHWDRTIPTGGDGTPVFAYTFKEYIKSLVVTWTTADYGTLKFMMKTFTPSIEPFLTAQELWDRGIKSAAHGFLFTPLIDTTNDFYSMAIQDVMLSEGGGEIRLHHTGAGDLIVKMFSLSYYNKT